MINVLVTGGAGFIGSNLVNELLKLETYNVFIFDNLSTGRITNLPIHHPNLKFYQLDLLSDFKNWPQLDNLEYIYHFSANADVRGGMFNRSIDLEQNVLVTKALCDYAKKNNCKHFIFASSATVYGEPETYPTKETAPLIQTSIYGASKLSGEAFIQSYSEYLDFQSTIFRFVSWIGYGYSHGVIYDFVKNTFEYSPAAQKMMKENPALADKLERLVKKSKKKLDDFKRIAKALGFDLKRSGVVMDRDTYDNLIRGGNNGHGIHKGNPYGSLIFKRVSMSQNEAKFMPPAGTPLSFDQVAVLKWWIDNGAKLKVPLTKLRNDENIRSLVEEKYRLDLREKSYIETLKLAPVDQNQLEVLDKGKYQWRFLNSEKSLLDIKFIGKKITFNDIELLLKLKEHVIWLNLSNCQLKDDMLSIISEFENLTRLRVQKNNITDKCIPYLKDVNNLKELNFYDTLITDNSFEVLTNLESLEKIFLWKSKVSTLGIEKFKSQKPKIEVITGL